MAQTKKRAAPKKRSGKKSQVRSGGSSTKPQARPGSSSSKTKSKSAKPKSSKAKSARSKPQSSNGVTAQIDSARHNVEDKAKAAGQGVGKAASKAKVPLIAGGAALAGAAGGMALASRQDRHRRLAAAMRKPRIKLSSKDVARAAKEVGSFTTQVGELASELQRNREGAEGNGKHRSPIEVVLHGLTARR